MYSTLSEHPPYIRYPAPRDYLGTSQPYRTTRPESQQSDFATTCTDARLAGSLYDSHRLNPCSTHGQQSCSDGMPDLAGSYVDLPPAPELNRNDVIMTAGAVTRAPNPQGALPPVFPGPSTSVGRNVRIRNRTDWKRCSVCDKSYRCEENSRGSDRDICPACANDHQPQAAQVSCHQGSDLAYYSETSCQCHIVVPSNIGVLPVASGPEICDDPTSCALIPAKRVYRNHERLPTSYPYMMYTDFAGR